MDIKNSIVAILNSRGKIVGTGFLASQNLVVTCAHVIVAAGAFYDDTVQVRFDRRTEKINALVVPEYWRDVDKGDVAVLRLESVPDGITPLPLGNAAGSAGHDFYAYGYAVVTGVQGIGARGKIVDIVDNGRLVQLTSQEPDHGMSGGPVLDEQRRVVIGMVTKGKGLLENQNLRNTQTTFATSIELIREVCPELRLTEICPYRSLEVFNEEDAPFFFGREKVVQKLLDSLKREPRFLAVLGPSGSGKSSVVRAGLIPALRQGKVPGSQKWEFVTIRPAYDPFEQLAGAGFISLNAGLESSVKTWLADRSDKTRLVLFIDQFEEVLVSASKDVRQKFIAELAQLLDAPLAITVVLSLRDDFYSRFLSDAAVFAGWLERGLVNIPSFLEQDDLQAMIFEPAKSVGIIFEEGLVDLIIANASGVSPKGDVARSTILPLLEFTLTELWKSKQNNQITLDVYHRIGGVVGSLAQWADQTYFILSPEDRDIARYLFTSLVHPGDEAFGVPDSRRIRELSEILFCNEKDTHPVINKLVKARLLTISHNHMIKKEMIELIHDALIGGWMQLKRWVENDRQFLVWRERLQYDLRRWENNRDVQDTLLFGKNFIESIDWLEQRQKDLNENELAYIQASIGFHKHLQAKEQALVDGQVEIAKNESVLTRTIMVADFSNRLINLAGTIPVWINLIQKRLSNERIVDNVLDNYLNNISEDVDDLLREADRLKFAPQSSEIDLEVLLDSLVRQAYVQYPPAVIVHLNYPSHLPKIIANRSDLSNAFWNIIDNGAAAINLDGQIDIDVDMPDEKQMVISINNIGNGVTNIIKNDIFTPFTTTKDGHPGYGLWRAKYIFESLGGTVNLENGKREIAFIITLPISQ